MTKTKRINDVKERKHFNALHQKHNTSLGIMLHKYPLLNSLLLFISLELKMCCLLYAIPRYPNQSMKCEGIVEIC